jgi:predicted nucleic acid-binding protein
MLLIDSTIYIDWFRRRIDPRSILEPWIKARAVAICGIIRAEVLRGVIHPGQRNRIGALFDLLEEVPTDSGLWREVSDLAWQLDRRGVVLPLTDVAIAACSLRAGASLITTDEHFSSISGLNTLRAIPRLA